MCAAMIRVSSSFDDGDACAGPEQHRPPVEQQPRSQRMKPLVERTIGEAMGADGGDCDDKRCGQPD